MFPLSFQSTPDDHSVNPQRYEATCWDFAGQDIYHVAHSLFFSKRTLYLLCVDLEAYDKALDTLWDQDSELQRFVVDRVFRWARLILARRPDAELVIVGTKTDLLTSSQIEDVREDLRERLRKWVDGFVKEHEGYQQAEVKKSLRQLVESDELFVNVTSVETVIEAKQAIANVITDKKERAFVMPILYTRVLDAIQVRRKKVDTVSHSDHVVSMVVTSEALVKELTNEINGLCADECRDILRTLHELGDILWYEDQIDRAFEDVITLDPTTVLDVVREVVNHNHETAVGEAYDALRSDGEMKHALLITFPVWKALWNKSGKLVLFFKTLLKHFNLAYPVGNDAMAIDSNLCVPAFWKLRRDGAALARIETGEAVPGSCLARWQYSLSAELSGTVFDQFIVQSQTYLFDRVATASCLEVRLRSAASQVLARIIFKSGSQTKDNICIEVTALEHTQCWDLIRFFVTAMEKVLLGYPGLGAIDRVILVGVPGHQVTSYAVKNVAKQLSNTNAKPAAARNPGFPDDLTWFSQKAWETSDLKELAEGIVGFLSQTTSASCRAP